MKASEYFKRKKEFVPYITEAYKKLSEKNDIIVIEGAGSPAEINLKQNDIVNMGLAKMLSAPVLLTGDIDRGGVFAQLLGTMELLEKEERALVKGVVINKFRGDIELSLIHISKNIDLFFSENNTAKALFAEHAQGSDICVIEGVMGYYDGLSFDDDKVSTYSVADVLSAPSVIVLNARGMALTASAIIQGMINFRDNSRIRAVILNNISPCLLYTSTDFILKT